MYILFLHHIQYLGPNTADSSHLKLPIPLSRLKLTLQPFADPVSGTCPGPGTPALAIPNKARLTPGAVRYHDPEVIIHIEVNDGGDRIAGPLWVCVKVLVGGVAEVGSAARPVLSVIDLSSVLDMFCGGLLHRRRYLLWWVVGLVDGGVCRDADGLEATLGCEIIFHLACE